MKRFICYLICVVFVLVSSVTSFASEIEDNFDNDLDLVPFEPENSSDEYLSMVLNEMQQDIDNLESEVSTIKDDVSSLSQSDTLSDTTSFDVVQDENPSLGPSEEETIITGVSVYSVSPVAPSDTNGLKAVLLSVLGDYDAIVVEYQYQNASGTSYNYLREIQPDYVWIASFCMLALVVYCVFRLGGALIG